MAERIDFTDRVVIVTGANGELGGAYASLLAERRAKVVCFDLSEGVKEFAHKLNAAGGEALAVVGSITSQQDIDQLVETVIQKYGRIDGLVNSAGFAYQRKFMDTTMEDHRKLFEMHYWGPLALTRAVWPQMAKQNYGRIVNITSTSAFGLEEWANYTAAKSAQFALARSLALEARHVGIQINAMAPSATTKAMMRNITDPKILSEVKEARPEFCAPLVVYLLSESCPYNGHGFFATRGYVSEILWATQKKGMDTNITLEMVSDWLTKDCKEPVRVHEFCLDQVASVNL